MAEQNSTLVSLTALKTRGFLIPLWVLVNSKSRDARRKKDGQIYLICHNQGRLLKVKY